jgi:cation/acetate symporter
LARPLKRRAGRTVDQGRQNNGGTARWAACPNHGADLRLGQPTPRRQKTFNVSRRNFLALVFCLMVGTAALPHILMRYYTTPSVREARESVTWSLFFIFLLYFTAPALAVLVKYEVFNVLVGTPFDKLPAWIASWQRVDPTLLSVIDINGDGIFQLGEMKIGGDIIVLATPEIGGLPVRGIGHGGRGWPRSGAFHC